MCEEMKQGRPRGFDTDEALSQVLHLFWDRGFDNVSYADLMTATGLRKGSLYAAFGDKVSLYRRALEHYRQMKIAKMLEILNDNAMAPAIRIERFLNHPIDAGDKGCFLCGAASDFATRDDASAESVRDAFAELHAALKGVIADLLPDLSEIEVDQRAAHLLATYNGLQTMSRIAPASHIMHAAITSALSDVQRKA